jgi:hypothetical protein
MIKVSKFVKIAIDETIYSSSKAPETIDEWDGACPACGSGLYNEVVTVIQHGFELDACLTLVHCLNCFETFHYYYTVEAACLDECRPSEIADYRSDTTKS